jgi:hypothetical protein
VTVSIWAETRRGRGNGHCINQGHERRNHEVPPSALAAGEQGDAIRGFGDHSAHNLSPQDEVDSRRP